MRRFCDINLVVSLLGIARSGEQILKSFSSPFAMVVVTSMTHTSQVANVIRKQSWPDAQQPFDPITFAKERPDFVSYRRPRIRPCVPQPTSPTTSLHDVRCVSPRVAIDTSSPEILPSSSFRTSLWSVTNDIMRGGHVRRAASLDTATSLCSVSDSEDTNQSLRSHERAASLYKDAKEGRQQRRVKLHTGLHASLAAASI